MDCLYGTNPTPARRGGTLPPRPASLTIPAGRKGRRGRNPRSRTWKGGLSALSLSIGRVRARRDRLGVVHGTPPDRAVRQRVEGFEQAATVVRVASRQAPHGDH